MTKNSVHNELLFSPFRELHGSEHGICKALDVKTGEVREGPGSEELVRGDHGMLGKKLPCQRVPCEFRSSE